MKGIWATYRDLLMETENQLKQKKNEEVKELMADWLEYYQIRDMFKIDKRKGFDTRSKSEVELLDNNVKIL